MVVCQTYAATNRRLISRYIINALSFDSDNDFVSFDTVHNYIHDGMIRKGAVSAKAGQKLLIPINMKDGSLVCIGKGNSEWNESAPHGAGRLMSRRKAKETLKMEDFQSSMAGIYTTSVHQSTLDEAPMAYKPIEAILDNIGDTVEVINRIVPIYNFKAGE